MARSTETAAYGRAGAIAEAIPPLTARATRGRKTQSWYPGASLCQRLRCVSSSEAESTLEGDVEVRAERTERVQGSRQADGSSPLLVPLVRRRGKF